MPVFRHARGGFSYKSPPESVYAFETLTTDALYHQRDGARLEFFRNRYWLLGGWWPNDDRDWGPEVTTNEVWSSTDLVTWVRELAHDPEPPISGANARWRRRHTFPSAVYAEHLWVLGGDGSDDQYAHCPSDVWRSADGVTWERVAAESPWGPKYLPIVSVYRDAIYIFGGYDINGFASCEAWRTTDGRSWERLPDMPFSRAAVYAAVVLDDRVHVCGGSSGNVGNRTLHNDSWAWDGRRWQRMSAHALWSPRDWIATASYDGRIWAITGAEPSNAGGIWQSADGGATWYRVTGEPWCGSHADAITVTSAGIVIASGNGHERNVYRMYAA